MVESCEETIALEESMENIRKLEETVGKMRTLQKGNAGKTFEKARHIETTKKPKLNGEQRPLGFGPRQFARGRAALPRNECWKMVESCEETIVLEVVKPRKLEKPLGKEAMVGRKLWKDPSENVGPG